MTPETMEDFVRPFRDRLVEAALDEHLSAMTPDQADAVDQNALRLTLAEELQEEAEIAARDWAYDEHAGGRA